MNKIKMSLSIDYLVFGVILPCSFCRCRDWKDRLTLRHDRLTVYNMVPEFLIPLLIIVFSSAVIECLHI